MKGCDGCGRVLELLESNISIYTMEFNGVRYEYCSGQCVQNHIREMRVELEEKANKLSDTTCSKCGLFIKERELNIYKVLDQHFCYDCWANIKDHTVEIDINDYKLQSNDG